MKTRDVKGQHGRLIYFPDAPIVPGFDVARDHAGSEWVATAKVVGGCRVSVASRDVRELQALCRLMRARLPLEVG